MANDSTKGLSPEAAQILDLFASRVESSIKSAQLSVQAEVQSARQDMARNLEATEVRIGKTLDEIKEDQREQRLSLEQQGRDLTRMGTRLEEGEKRFADQSQKIKQLQDNTASKQDLEKLEGRVETLEGGHQGVVKSLAYLAGAASGGGAVGAWITHLLGG